MISEWVTATGPESDVAMSTRIRLARNLDNYLFPVRMSGEEAASLVTEITDYAKSQPHFQALVMETLPSIEKRVLMEKHLISPALVRKSLYGGCLISEDEAISIMLNEEDHLRIQTMTPGLGLEDALKSANQVDDWLEASVTYAFDEKKGYLTSCPTNVGTGLRASVMMHLPGLVMTKQMSRILPIMNKLGFVVRGIYGEGSEALGSVFQVSNQTTLGKSEGEIIQDLHGVIGQLIAQERTARENIASELGLQLEDKIWRAYGTLAHSRMIDGKEAAECLSYLRLGIDLSLIPNLSPSIFNELMIAIQPGMIGQHVGATLRPEEVAIKRATFIRERLEEELV